MKKIIVTIAAAVSVFSAAAQTLEEGIKMYRYEKYNSAKKILQPLAATDPMANYYLGLAELEMGNVDAAKDLFVKYPEDLANISGTVRVKFAKEGAAAGTQAANSLADMGKKKDWLPKKYAADAITYSTGGNYQQAVDWYKEVMEKMVTPDILISTGDAYQQISGGGGEAMNHYEKAVAKDPNNSLAYSRIGKLWYNARNYDLALENWNKAQKADPNNPLPYYDLANAYTYVGKYDVAKENIEKYIQLSDRTTADLVRYIEILFLAKDYDKAIQQVKELRSKGVERVQFYGILGYAYTDSKDTADAAKALENMQLYFSKREKEKLTVLDNLTLARAYLMNNKNDSANIVFKRALAMDTTDNKIATYRDIAETYRTARSWLDAANWYEMIYNDFPDAATATDYFWGGYSFFLASTDTKDSTETARRLEKADKIYATMTEKFPEQPSGFYWRARVNASRDQEAKEGLATPYFEQWLNMDVEGATKSDKDKLIAYQYLALYYYNKENAAEALKYADQILGLDPGNELGKQLKDLLKKK